MVADETPVGVQSPDAPKGQNHRGWQWQYNTPGGPVVFDFQMSRSRAGPAAFLRDYRGVLQTDAYSAYDGVIGPGIIHAGCWPMHDASFTRPTNSTPLTQPPEKCSNASAGSTTSNAKPAKRSYPRRPANNAGRNRAHRKWPR